MYLNYMKIQYCCKIVICGVKLNGSKIVKLKILDDFDKIFIADTYIYNIFKLCIYILFIYLFIFIYIYLYIYIYIYTLYIYIYTLYIYIYILYIYIYILYIYTNFAFFVCFCHCATHTHTAFLLMYNV